jgi:hypothetical protein
MSPSTVDRELSHVRDLVVVREALRLRGATSIELGECDAVIAAARERLAHATRTMLVAPGVVRAA